MAWDEARAWLSGTLNGSLYQNLLDDALAAPARNARRKKIIHPEDMPWEMARPILCSPSKNLPLL